MRRSIVLVMALLIAVALSIAPSAGAAGTDGVRPQPMLRVRTAGIVSRRAPDAPAGPGQTGRPLPDPAWPDLRPRRIVRGDRRGRTAVRTPSLDATLDFDTLGPDPLVSPGDPTGALGPDAVVAAVNVRVAVYDRTGVQLTTPQRLNELAGRPGAAETDPKVFYDPYDDEYVVTFLTFNDAREWIDVVTIPVATPSDQQTWCLTEMEGDQVPGDGRQFADYPTVGFTANRVTIATNNFAWDLSGFDYAQIISMKKSQLYDPSCARSIHLDVLGGEQTRDPDGSKAFTIQPAMSIGGAPTDQYLLSVDVGQRSTSLVLWRLRFGNGGPNLKRVAIPVRRAQLPPYGFQCGSTDRPTTWWDTGDLRLMNAWYDADRNRIYTSHAVLGHPGGGAPESVIRWYELRPDSRLPASTVTRMARIASPGHDAAWSSVATTADGRLWVTYARAGLDECLSSWVASVPLGTSVSKKVSVVEGEMRYEFSSRAGASHGVERWGDYSATNRDPLDPNAIGSFNAYAKASGAVTTPLFMLRVTRLTDV